MTAVKNAIVSWLLNFRIRMFMKSAVRVIYKSHKFDRAKTDLAGLGHRVWRLSRNYFGALYFKLKLTPTLPEKGTPLLGGLAQYAIKESKESCLVVVTDN